jgi:hypothetical protein
MSLLPQLPAHLDADMLTHACSQFLSLGLVLLGQPTPPTPKKLISAFHGLTVFICGCQTVH